MAQSLRCKLHTLSSSRLPPPASVFKLFRSPDLRLSSRRWLASDALMEEQGISVTDTDGGSSAANDDESLVEVLKGVRGMQIDEVPAPHYTSSEFPSAGLELNTSRHPSLASAKRPAPRSILQGDGASKNRMQSDQGEQSIKSFDDTWRQMVSSIRSMSLKKKLKGVQGNTSNTRSSLKTEPSKALVDFHDLDLPHSGGESSTDILVESVSGSQSTVSQNTSSLKEFLKNKGKSSLDSTSQNGADIKVNKRLSDKEGSLEGTEGYSDLHKASKPEDSSFQSRTHVKNKDKLPSMTAGQEPSLTRTPEDCSVQDTDHLVIKDSANYKLFSQTSTALADSRFKQDASFQASDKNNGISRQSYMVCVQNLPPSSNPSSIKASMAVHGEVVGFFKKSIHDRLNVYIQFKTAVAMENALASRTLQVGSKRCSISRTDNPAFTTVVRISKVASDTDEQEIRTVCEQYGKVDDVKKRMHTVFDVFYNFKELSNIPHILGSLCDVTLNRSTWLAFPAPLLHPSVQKELVKSPEGQSWLDTHINQTIYRVEAGLDALSVSFQDLKEVNTVAREFFK